MKCKVKLRWLRIIWFYQLSGIELDKRLEPCELVWKRGVKIKTDVQNILSRLHFKTVEFMSILKLFPFFGRKAWSPIQETQNHSQADQTKFNF